MVRYADAPAAAVERRIDAPIAAVWPLVVDVNMPARFSQELQGARWVSDGGPAVGAVFEGTNSHPIVGEWTTTCTVTGYAEGSVFEWVVGDPENKVARWRFDLRDDGGATVLRFSAEMGPGPSGLSVAIAGNPEREEAIVARRLQEWEANMALTLEGIRALVEEG